MNNKEITSFDSFCYNGLSPVRMQTPPPISNFQMIQLSYEPLYGFSSQKEVFPFVRQQIKIPPFNKYDYQCFSDENKEKEKIDEETSDYSLSIPDSYKPLPQFLTDDDSAALLHCNCSKSHCLKKYCECFAQGYICSDRCNCNGCKNTCKTEKKEFKESLGCKCKKTMCLKGYCECFLRKVKCGKHCKCEKCKNRPDLNKKNEGKKNKKRDFITQTGLEIKVVDENEFEKTRNNLIFNKRVFKFVFGEDFSEFRRKIIKI